MSIEVKDISKSYGEQKALDAVSFSIKKGEIVDSDDLNSFGKMFVMLCCRSYAL